MSARRCGSTGGTADQVLPVHEAAETYAGTPLAVVAGRNYGAGSSRDWAAKAQALLGVRAVIAESFERIHRSNLIGMGVLPLRFREGDSAAAFTGDEEPALRLPDELEAGTNPVRPAIARPGGEREQLVLDLRLDTRNDAPRRHPAVRGAAADLRPGGAAGGIATPAAPANLSAR